MRLQEVCFLIAGDGAVLWADAGAGPGAIPDSRERWEKIWELRHRLAVIAHSHPLGPAAFSHEDETTMAALDTALGRALDFAVVTPEVTIIRAGEGIGELDPEPWWAELLRLASGMKG